MEIPSTKEDSTVIPYQGNRITDVLLFLSPQQACSTSPSLLDVATRALQTIRRLSICTSGEIGQLLSSYQALVEQLCTGDSALDNDMEIIERISQLQESARKAKEKWRRKQYRKRNSP